MSFKGMAYLSSRWIIRQPAWILQSIMTMLGFIVILYAWGGLEGIRNLVIAGLIMSSWQSGINLVAQMIGWDRVSRSLHMYVASPIRPLHYILGNFVSSMIFLVAELVIMGALALYLGFLVELAAAIAVSIPLIFMSMLLGISIVMRLREGTNVSAVTNPIASILSILPPVLYPATLVPKSIVLYGVQIPLRKIVLAIPTATAAELARQIAGITCSEPFIYVALVYLLWIVASAIAAAHVIKWGHE